MMQQITRSLEDITTEAIAIYDRMEKDYRRWGELMVEAKKLVPRGEWLPYLEKNFPEFGQRQAQRYMQIAKDPTKTLASVTSRGLNTTHESYLVTRPQTPSNLQHLIRKLDPKAELDQIQKDFFNDIRNLRKHFGELVEWCEGNPGTDIPIRQSFKNEIEIGMKAMEKLYERFINATEPGSGHIEREVLPPWKTD